MAKKRKQALYFLANVRGDTWFHRIDPRVKVIFLLGFITVDLLFLDPRFLFLALLTTIPIWITARVDLRPLLPVIFGLVLTFVGLFLFVFSASTSIATYGVGVVEQAGIHLGPFIIYPVALGDGLVHIFRMAIPISTSLLVFATTDPADFARAIHKWKAPREVSFLLVTALRLFPITLEEFGNIRQAQRVRGVSTRGVVNNFKAMMSTSFPLLVIMLRKSRQMGVAIEGRGFGARQWKGALRVWKLGLNDYLLLVWISLLLLGTLYLRFVLGLGWGTLVI